MPPFTTPRLERWLQADLGDLHAETIRTIAQYGCHILQLKGTPTTPGYSYSIGLYDTLHQPEIIAVGLPQQAAITAINKAAALLRSGIDLTLGAHPNLLANRDCRFQPIDPKWANHLMGRALWYYEEDPPPTLQLLYPDLQNHRQSDPAFDPRFHQPLLQPNAPQTPKEQAFWQATS
jgi:hypothetical protein